MDDVRRSITWLSEHAHTSGIYGLGHSMGASLQAIGAGVPLRAVVADSPFATFRDVAYDRVEGVRRTCVPVLLIHGTADENIPLQR